MKFRIEIGDPRQLANVEAALKILDQGNEIVDENYDLSLIIDYSRDFWVRIRVPQLPAGEDVWEYQDQDILDPRYHKSDYPQRLKELIRLGIISLLGRDLDKKPIWGILSGVRPTKIFHFLRQRGFSISETRQKLLAIYQLDPVMVDLLIEVGEKQERFFKSSHYISVYIGIPFCPSRCQYCSFPAVSLETHHHLVKEFLVVLFMEIETTASLIREYGLMVESVYIGGGTPTSLDDADFTRLLHAVKDNLISSQTMEFTVEAGRPETVNPIKLQAMVGTGVSRICINPQTMHDETLSRIGRKHTVGQILEAVAMVKRFPSLSLNMDLILGLPGENGADFLRSCEQVIRLAPEAITIHALSPKRKAAWRRDFSKLELAENEEINEAGKRALGTIRKAGFSPYYLYRQRSSLADLANIGFAIPGQENTYNIQMMEERQTIFGMGAGAITKWVFGPDYRIIRLQNPKCPATYNHTIREQIVKKAQQTRLLLG